MGSRRRTALAERLVPRFPVGRAYVPHVPHPPQQAFLLLSFVPEVFYGGAAGGGKALALDTPLPTPAGWTTMGEVAPGDVLFGEDGVPTRVVWKSEVMVDRDCLEVVFSDGSSVVCDSGHLWASVAPGALERARRATPEFRAARRATRARRGRGVRPDLVARNEARRGRSGDTSTGPVTTAGSTATRTTRIGPRMSALPAWAHCDLTTAGELADEYAATPGRRRAVPVTAPLQLPPVELPVDPWVLGFWLGDGDTRRGYVTIGDDDEAELRARLEGAGYPTAPRGDRHFAVEGLRDRLVAAGLCGTKSRVTPKHIPAVYLRASLEQRLALLQGIVDSDGHVDATGQVEVTWTSRALVDGLLELLTSLGIKATARESRATLAGRDAGPRWRVKWLTGLPAARLTRKVAAQKRDGFRGTHGRRYITEVRRVPAVPVQCVTVDNGSGLYLAGSGMVPTHNSDAGLMAALQYVDVPGYSALVIRRTFQDLALPGAVMNRAESWLSGTSARKRDGGKLWEFPTVDPHRPATLQFGYAASHADVYRYQSAEFQCIFIDELTHFEERTYRYLFSRLRGPSVPCVSCGHPTSQPAGRPRTHDEGHDQCASCGHEHHPAEECAGCGCGDYVPAGCGCVAPEPDREATDSAGARLLPAAEDGTTLADVPLRMRAGSNPGGVGHEWVRARFVDPETRRSSAVFVPAKLADNPSIDRLAYRQALSALTEVERQRLEEGDWEVSDDGDVFDRSWFRIVDEESIPAGCRWVRYWDMAASVPKPPARGRPKTDPDWTVGALVGLSSDGRWWVKDVRRFRKKPLESQTELVQCAALDGRGVAVRMEQEPGASGVTVIDTFRREVFAGFDFDGVRPSLSKQERAAPVARAAQAGNVALVSAPWNQVFLDELAGFPGLPHDDQVDAVSGAFEALTSRPRARIIA